MDLLQQVTEFENTEVDCPLAADDCKLYFDSDNTRVVLKLAFKDHNDEHAHPAKQRVPIFSEALENRSADGDEKR